MRRSIKEPGIKTKKEQGVPGPTRHFPAERA